MKNESVTEKTNFDQKTNEQKAKMAINKLANITGLLRFQI